MKKFINVNEAAILIDRYADSLDKQSDKNIAEAIKDIVITITPSSEVEEVRHGVWEIISIFGIFRVVRCSDCKQMFKVKNLSPYWRKCPCCGANMDGKKDEVTE